MKQITTTLGSLYHLSLRRPLVWTAREGEDDDDDDDDAALKSLDPKIAKAVTKIVNKSIHGAMAERDKREAPKRAKELSDALAGFGTTLLEQVKGLIPKAPAADDEHGDEKGGKGGKGGKPSTDPEVLKLRAEREADRERFEKLEKNITAEREKAEKAEAKSREQEEDQLVNKMLTEAKVRPNLARMAADNIRRTYITREVTETDGVKTYGPPQWKGEDDTFLDPKKGFQKYLSTDEGKELQAPVNAGGAGSGRPRTGNAGGGKEFSFEDLGDKVIGGGRR